MRDPEELGTWIVGAFLTLVLIALSIGLAWFVIDAIGDARSKNACRDRGGRVEHYDADHSRYWRCQLPTPERP